MDAANSVRRIGVAGRAPVTKLRHIDAAIPRFAVEDPGLGSLENLTDLPLREAGFLPQFPEEGGDVGVAAFVLGLGHHKYPPLLSKNRLTRFPYLAILWGRMQGPMETPGGLPHAVNQRWTI